MRGQSDGLVMGLPAVRWEMCVGLRMGNESTEFGDTYW